MLQAATTVLFNPLVPEGHKSECQISFTNLANKSWLKLV